ncbi:hypothetical protein QQS21_012819 [Conoideocrella luteorostrata]|uniref:Intramembrane protease n=1 Tax=Conoideocrella luteorostrata TaxID=1105319 RepID=A0AAJ0CF13_9HYPO|nr:hypothetical protein QQS21_012819 [Conoideocrella luteorostrata]
MASNTTLEPGALDTFNITLNNQTQTSASVLSNLKDLDFMLLEAKLVLSALSIMYFGSHAAIRRPPSAAPPRESKGRKPNDADRFSQGLEPSDAIVFPVMAAILLVGLYYLIQWLQDPAILNRILRYYMTTVSIASVLTLYSHGIDMGISFLFPAYWRGRDGSLRKVDQKNKSITICDNVGNPVGEPSAETNPLPPGDIFSSEAERSKIWELRGLVTRYWNIVLFAHGVGEVKAKIRFSHVMASALSITTGLAYFSTTSPFLSNMLGPYMVTVATTLDVPIKLTFETASRKSLLGLGDIVIPGMVIAWALRLDLWLHYMRKVKYESVDLILVEKDASSGQIVRRSETKHKEVKAAYIDVKNGWGESFWTRGAMFLSRPQQLPPKLAAARFPKVYFWAAMAGYSAGMGVTLAMLLVFKRGQPALLYLVPGVLGALVLTALVRGEFKDMWKYTENGSLDTMDVVVNLDGDGNATERIGELEDGVVDTTKDEKEKEKEKAKKINADDGNGGGNGEGKDKPNVAKGAEGQKGRKVFVLSIEVPLEGESENSGED